jgi:hypothetical protein
MNSNVFSRPDGPTSRVHAPLSPAVETAGVQVARARAPYTAPVLEPLGRWSAMTLAMSICVGPAGCD